ncbi:MAG: hypothetical protein ACF788_02550, partial [Novipirellula sp. JB048]
MTIEKGVIATGEFGWVANLSGWHESQILVRKFWWVARIGHDGSPNRGVVSATFTPNQLSDEKVLTDLAVYPPVDIEGTESRLIVRTRAAYPGGDEVPRELWSLQDNCIRLEGGFEAGKTNEVFYLAEEPPVGGLGYAAIRDAVAW